VFAKLEQVSQSPDLRIAYMEKTPANTMDRPLMMKNAWLFSSRCDFNYKIGKEFPQHANIMAIRMNAQ